MRRLYKPPDQWNRHNSKIADQLWSSYVHNAETIMKSNRERKNRQVARARQSCKEVTYSTRKKWTKPPKQGRKRDQPKKTKKPQKNTEKI